MARALHDDEESDECGMTDPRRWDSVRPGSSLRERRPELLDGRLLDVCDDPEQAGEPLEFVDPGAVDLPLEWRTKLFC